MSETVRSRTALVGRAMLRLVGGTVLAGVVLFVPAGTIDWWQAWLFLATLTALMLTIAIYLAIVDPALLDRRLRSREREAEQRRLIVIGTISFVVGFLVPGIDRRFGWSYVPTGVVLVGELGVILGYALFAIVMRVNSYASRIIEVAEGQQVVTNGPYAVVRHPMYVAALIIYLATPLVLGSWWGLLAMLAQIPVYVARILGEERVLARDLPGYVAYMQRTRFRLLPGIW